MDTNEHMELIKEVQKDFPLPGPPANLEELERFLSSHINELISEDFDKLVRILYRLDINEHRLKNLLHENKGMDAALIITRLIMEREAEKIKSRREFRQRDEDIDENEKW